jgi:hypothetical protein
MIVDKHKEFLWITEIQSVQRGLRYRNGQLPQLSHK